MNINDVLKTRRSVRLYQDKPVSDDDIHRMIEAAILAPSWKNSQVTRYHVVKSPEILEDVKKALPEFNQNNVKNAPVLIISTILLNRSGFERDGSSSTELGNEWGYYDCGLHNMNLLLKATELGLGTLVMGIRDEHLLQGILQLEENEAIVSVIAVGYPAHDPHMPKRKTVEEIIKIY